MMQGKMKEARLIDDKEAEDKEAARCQECRNGESEETSEEQKICDEGKAKR